MEGASLDLVAVAGAGAAAVVAVVVGGGVETPCAVKPAAGAPDAAVAAAAAAGGAMVRAAASAAEDVTGVAECAAVGDGGAAVPLAAALVDPEEDEAEKERKIKKRKKRSTIKLPNTTTHSHYLFSRGLRNSNITKSSRIVNVRIIQFFEYTIWTPTQCHMSRVPHVVFGAKEARRGWATPA